MKPYKEFEAEMLAAIARFESCNADLKEFTGFVFQKVVEINKCCKVKEIQLDPEIKEHLEALYTRTIGFMHSD